MDQEKHAQAIRKAIADRNAQSAAEREKIYAAARAAVGRNGNGGPAAMALLDSTISTIEASFAPKAVASAGTGGWRGKWTWHLPALGIGLFLGAMATALVMPNDLPAMPKSEKAAVVLENKYETALPQVPIAVDFLNKVSDAVIAMQKSDRAGLEAKASKAFVSLAALDPELAKQMPAALPVGSAVIVRADRSDFKILFNWTLCGAVQIARPEMIDHVRDRVNGLGCPYFGLWTTGGANW
jgi:hypothetical protein